mmetsp:Transcript_43157/g.81018  ORF Transcript_43157/g.81018 Transcript_43157/m.81018 type:complete len:223 (-) Transcript_43157:98-766(-)
MRCTALVLALLSFTGHGRRLLTQNEAFDPMEAFEMLLLSRHPAITAFNPSFASTRSPVAVSDAFAQRVCTPVMGKKIKQVIKLIIEAGKASPSPPVGPALGAAGLNIMGFCKEFNAKTQDKKGEIIPAEITAYEDRTFSFILKTPPTSELIKKYAKIKKGSGTPGGRDYVKAGSITLEQVKAIAEVKLPDLNTNEIEPAMNTVIGTARNMGVEVEGDNYRTK